MEGIKGLIKDASKKENKRCTQERGNKKYKSQNQGSIRKYKNNR